MGKPLNLETNSSAVINRLLIASSRATATLPLEIELANGDPPRAQRRWRLVWRESSTGARCCGARRVPPFASERRAYNAFVEKTADEYDKALRDLNRKILTLI